MINAKIKPYTEMSLLEFQARFPDEQSCWNYLGKMRWPKGFICSKCKNDTSCFLKQRKVFQCNRCKWQQSATAGTIFHKSRVPLQNGFVLIQTLLRPFSLAFHFGKVKHINSPYLIQPLRPLSDKLLSICYLVNSLQA